MAMRCCPHEIMPKEVKDPCIRYLTVSDAWTPLERERVPALVLKGRWLEKAGFPIGTLVDVWVRHGCLVLTARNEQAEALKEKEQQEELEEQELMAMAE